MPFRHNDCVDCGKGQHFTHISLAGLWRGKVPEGIIKMVSLHNCSFFLEGGLESLSNLVN